jgi:hypothetical protein
MLRNEEKFIMIDIEIDNDLNKLKDVLIAKKARIERILQAMEETAISSARKRTTAATRHLSQAAKNRIGAAQRARWAKVRKEAKVKASKNASKVSKMPTPKAI